MGINDLLVSKPKLFMQLLHFQSPKTFKICKPCFKKVLKTYLVLENIFFEVSLHFMVLHGYDISIAAPSLIPLTSYPITELPSQCIIRYSSEIFSFKNSFFFLSLLCIISCSIKTFALYFHLAAHASSTLL